VVVQKEWNETENSNDEKKIVKEGPTRCQELRR
jgi:hypothetical protein